MDKIQKIENDWPLVGLCHIFTIIGVDPNDLPEFLVHRPEDKTLKEHWWPTDSRDPNREEVLRDCIEKTKPL